MAKETIRDALTWCAENELAALIVGILGLGFTFTVGIVVPVLGVVTFPISAVMVVSALLGMRN